ncbi:MAG: flagellar hook-basal body complex protein, partial [Thermodesulfobacteriota bacterium]|nr:flagellar hook-basal body complex protein [Thermodesulfobacteriota bacterium]
MSISSSLYTSMSGLFCLGDKIGTLGDNIANINTTGFRANEVNFEDILFETTHTGGVRFDGEGVTSDFSKEGSVQSSHIATHMAISGDGFFILRDQEETDSTYYSRAGEFNFNSEGYLLNPNGYIVQGYQFSSEGTEGTALADIQLELTAPAPTPENPDPAPRLVSSPSASTRLTLITNVDARSQDNSPGGLFSNYDGTNASPLDLTDYELRSDQDLYDSFGDRYPIAVYYDKISQDGVWEYLITSPSDIPGTATDDGVLARGTITYNGNGIIEDMTLENYQGAGWVNSAINDNGFYTFQTPFAGAGAMEFDIGSRYVNGSWQPAAQSSTQYGCSSYTIFSKTDGYGEGDLLNFSVSMDGIIRASFDNGVISDLFRVGLANVSTPSSHLRRIGHTFFQAIDPDSQDLITEDIPGSSGLGMIIGSSLESSNVDMAEQFGDLILTQRAFQANSKGIVTAD